MAESFHDDDAPVGRILTRREAVTILGGAGAAGFLTLAGCSPGSSKGSAFASTTDTNGSTVSCAVKPEMTEGPYFVDEKLNRADIRSDPSTGKVSAGAPLDLEIRVYRIANGACTPYKDAMVDIWQCDAMGLYSDVRDMNGLFNTAGQKFLRG
jgi:protocatechuate 3,4-dioxygenase beta subunit